MEHYKDTHRAPASLASLPLVNDMGAAQSRSAGYSEWSGLSHHIALFGEWIFATGKGSKARISVDPQLHSFEARGYVGEVLENMTEEEKEEVAGWSIVY